MGIAFQKYRYILSVTIRSLWRLGLVHISMLALQRLQTEIDASFLVC